MAYRQLKPLPFVGNDPNLLTAWANFKKLANLASSYWIVPEDYGPTGTDDDYTPLSRAVTDSATYGLPVLLSKLYNTAQTLNLPLGSILVGHGWGRSPITTPSTLTRGIQYNGSGTAISVNDSSVWLRDFAIYSPNSTPTKGLLLNGDGNALESCMFERLWIYGFTGGTALEMQGINGGSVAYPSFYGMRIRNAKCGIYSHNTGGAGGFANTMQFYGGAISGGDGIFDYGIRLNGSNDLKFWGTSVEPYTSTYGHIYVENAPLVGGALVGPGSLDFYGRIEGAHQNTHPHETRPLVYFGRGTRGSRISTSVGIAGLIEDHGQNYVNDPSPKSPKLPAHTDNLFDNPCWEGVSGLSIPSWTLAGASAVAIQAADPIENFPVLKLTVPNGATCTLKQALNTTTNNDKSVVFGALVKCSITPIDTGVVGTDQGVIWASSTDDGTTTTTVGAGYHRGDGEWDFIGGLQNMADNCALARPFINIVNNTGVDQFVYVAAPVASRGVEFPTLLATTGIGLFVKQTSPTFLGTISGVNQTLSGLAKSATLETTGKAGIGQAVGTYQMEITAGSGAHLLLQGSQIPELYLKSTTGNANQRNWRIRTNTNVFGDFAIQVSNANNTAPSIDVLLSDKSGNVSIPTGTLTLGNNLNRVTQANIIASATQTQGQTQLYADINFVGTVGTANDVVTLPAAAAGLGIYIRNGGANTLQIFPASGDAINGAAVNASTTLAAGASVTYYAADATNWYS